MYLTVSPPLGKVRISAPIKAKDEVIKQFACSKLVWIRKQLLKIERQQRPSEREYETGESHYLWGEIYQLEIEYAGKANKVELDADKIILTVRESSTREQRAKLMNEWYRAELKAMLPALFEKWEKIIGVNSNEICVKNMHTRWGTCNVRDKRIWINLQLAKRPYSCLEYVVVHELVHLLEKNHSAAFWSHVDRLLPDWHATREELRKCQ